SAREAQCGTCVPAGGLLRPDNSVLLAAVRPRGPRRASDFPVIVDGPGLALLERQTGQSTQVSDRVRCRGFLGVRPRTGDNRERQEYQDKIVKSSMAAHEILLNTGLR